MSRRTEHTPARPAPAAVLALSIVLAAWLPIAGVAPSEAGDLSAEQRAEIERLEAIGYVSEAPLPDAAPGAKRGVTTHDPARSYGGPSLYTSGHGPIATLIDMEGRVLHRWERPSRDLWPGSADQRRRGAKHMRRAEVLENGDLLLIFEGLGIARLDAASNVLWHGVPGAHHDLEVQPNGDVYLLARRGRLVPWMNRKRPVLEDFVVVVDGKGREQRRVSVLEAFRGTSYRKLLRKRKGDVTHTNSVQVLRGPAPDGLPEFGSGNVLLSMRRNSILAVLDMSREKIVWAKVGDFDLQHDPSFLASGNLLLFDNGNRRRNQSRALELDPRTMETVWTYPRDRPDHFFTSCCGLAQRLPNGNTLIVSAHTGRAFEVTRSGEVVWEFLSPHVAMGFVKTLFDFVRLPPDFPVDWAVGE